MGRRLKELGYGVYRVQLCGGDIAFWPSGDTLLWRGENWQWPSWISAVLTQKSVTDLVLLGDWRPLHQEAVLLARARAVRIWVFEEGYLRPGFVTLEEGGVNARTSLPRDPAGIRLRAEEVGSLPSCTPSKAPNPMKGRVLDTAWHHVGNFFLWPLFVHYHTHRPYCIGRELVGLLPRYFSRHMRRRESIAIFRDLMHKNAPYYFMPLQLDSDSQIRIHSPFTGVLDAISYVIVNFSVNAPKNSYLLIKNHPLHNGLIKYRRYIHSIATAAGCLERVRFVESVKNSSIIDNCQALVLCNSTLGLTALTRGRAVFCLGASIYAMPGLAVSAEEMPLDAFWRNPRPPEPDLVNDFVTVLCHDALVPGNFYSRDGIEEAIAASLTRMGVA